MLSNTIFTLQIKTKCFTMVPLIPCFLTSFSGAIAILTTYCFHLTQDLCPCCSSARNSLPSLHLVNSCACFRSCLSSHLLQKAFPDCHALPKLGRFPHSIAFLSAGAQKPVGTCLQPTECLSFQVYRTISSMSRFPARQCQMDWVCLAHHRVHQHLSTAPGTQ